MNIYDQAEIDRINKTKEINEKLEEFFNGKREEWTNLITPLFTTLKLDFTKPRNFQKVLETQALALSYRQLLTEQINLFLNRRSKEETKVKKLKQDKFIFYAIGFSIKTNMSEKAVLMDGNIAENDRTLQIIEAYIQFMRDSVKNLESVGYSIKNITELHNYLNNARS